jgi:hypothetical protein
MEFFAFNNLPSRFSFQQRALYKEHGMRNLDDALNLTDFWYKSPLYGKVDNKGRVVVPNENFLVPVFDNNAVYALDFVATAYRDFKRSFLSHLADTGGIQNYNSKLVNFIATKGWESADVAFNEHQKGLYEAFYSLMSENIPLRHKACNFKKFLNIYEWFNNEAIKHTIPITQAGFIKSKYCSPNVSGLIIEIMSDLEVGDASEIQRTFLDDPLFEIYVKKAAQFGFSIDKHAPWRLVARITAKPMQYYMKLLNKSWKEFFSDYYIPITFSDFEDFQMTAQEFYNSFRAGFPSETKVVLVDNNDDSYMKLRNIVRPKATYSTLDVLSELQWLKKYYNYRVKEDSIKLSKHMLKREMKKITRYYGKNFLEDTIEMMELQCGLAKLPKGAFPKIRHKRFHIGAYDPQSGIYFPEPYEDALTQSAKPKSKRRVSWRKKKIVKMTTPTTPSAGGY